MFKYVSVCVLFISSAVVAEHLFCKKQLSSYFSFNKLTLKAKNESYLYQIANYYQTDFNKACPTALSLQIMSEHFEKLDQTIEILVSAICNNTCTDSIKVILKNGMGNYCKQLQDLEFVRPFITQELKCHGGALNQTIQNLISIYNATYEYDCQNNRLSDFILKNYGTDCLTDENSETIYECVKNSYYNYNESLKSSTISMRFDNNLCQFISHVKKCVLTELRKCDYGEAEVTFVEEYYKVLHNATLCKQYSSSAGGSSVFPLSIFITLLIGHIFYQSLSNF